MIGYWANDRLKITVLLGWKAQCAFEKMGRDALQRSRLSHLKRIDLSHPMHASHQT